jgi:hypothetical protein
MKRARAACTGEAANLQESFIAASEYIREAFDKAADTLNKLGIALTSDDEDDEDDEDKGRQGETLTMNKMPSEDVQGVEHDPIRDLARRVMEEQVVQVWPNPSPVLHDIIGVKGDEQIPVAWEVKPVGTMEHLLWTVRNMLHKAHGDVLRPYIARDTQVVYYRGDDAPESLIIKAGTLYMYIAVHDVGAVIEFSHRGVNLVTETTMHILDGDNDVRCESKARAVAADTLAYVVEPWYMKQWKDFLHIAIVAGHRSRSPLDALHEIERHCEQLHKTNGFDLGSQAVTPAGLNGLLKTLTAFIDPNPRLWGSTFDVDTVQVNRGYGLQVIALKPTFKGTVSVKLYHLASGVEMTMHGATDPVERNSHRLPLTSLEWWFGDHDIALSDGKITATTITSTHVITALAELEIRIHDAMKDVN